MRKQLILIPFFFILLMGFASATVFDDNCTYTVQLNFTNPDAFDHDYEAFIDTHWNRDINVTTVTNIGTPNMSNVRLIQDDNEIPFNITGSGFNSIGVETILNISSSNENNTYLYYECDLPTADYSSCQTWDTCTPFINFFDDFDGSYDFSANGWSLESLYFHTYDGDIPNAVSGVATLDTLDGMHKAIPTPINTSENNNRYTIEFLAKTTSATATASILVATNDSIDSDRGHSYVYQIRIPATAWTTMMYQDGANGFSNFAQSSNASTNNVWYLYNGGREPDYTFFLRRNNSLLTNDVSDLNDTRFTMLNYVGLASAQTYSIDYLLTSLNRVENFENPSTVTAGFENGGANDTIPTVVVSDNITGNVSLNATVTFTINATDDNGVDYVVIEFNSSKYPDQSQPTTLTQINSSYPPFAQGFGSDGNNIVYYIQSPDGVNFWLYQRYINNLSLANPPCNLTTVSKGEGIAYNPLTDDLYVADLGTTDKIHVIDKTDCSPKYTIDYNYGGFTSGVSIWNNTLYVLPRTEVVSCPRNEPLPLFAGDPTSNTTYYNFTNDDYNQTIECYQGFEHQGEMYWIAYFNGTGGITVNNPDYYRLYGANGDMISQLDFTTFEPEGVAFGKYNGQDIMMMNTNEGAGTSYLGLTGTYIMYWNLTHTMLNQTFNELSANATSTDFTFQKAMIYEGSFAYRVHAVDSVGKTNTSDWVNFVVLDMTPLSPIISSVAPANNTQSNVVENVTFIVTDSDSSSVNCSLFVDSALNETITNITDNSTQTFTPTWSEGSHTWNINCTDGTLTKDSGTYSFLLDTQTPQLQSGSPSVFNTTIYSNYTMRVFGNATNGELAEVSVEIKYPNSTVFDTIINNTFPANTTVWGWDKTYNTTTIPNGNYTATLFANDTASNEATVEITFEVNNCMTDWVCSGYGSCNITNLAPCNTTTDNNVCGVAYTGNFTEFSPQSCDYCDDSVSIINSTSCNSVTDTLMNWYEDSNFGTCCNITGIATDCYDDIVQNSSITTAVESCSIFDYTQGDIGLASISTLTKFVIAFGVFAFLVLFIWLYPSFKTFVVKK